MPALLHSWRFKPVAGIPDLHVESLGLSAFALNVPLVRFIRRYRVHLFHLRIDRSPSDRAPGSASVVFCEAPVTLPQAADLFAPTLSSKSSKS